MEINLRSYQKEVHDQAVEKLRAYHLVYIAAEMRIGKTLTSLTIAQTMGYKNVMMFTKKKAISSINKDYVSGQFKFAFMCFNYEFLQSYALKDPQFNAQRFGSALMRPDALILDEAHGLGQFPNPANKVAYIKKIAESFQCDIIYLSGTPSPESFSQLYHQFHVSPFSPLKEYNTFYQFANGIFEKDELGVRIPIKEGFVIPEFIYYFGRKMSQYHNCDKDKLFPIINHLFVTMTQQEADFKQEVVDNFCTIQMKPSTYYLAKKLLKDRIYEGKEKEVIMADTAAALQQKLHQIYSGTVITENFFDDNGVALPEPVKIAKIFDTSKGDFIKNLFIPTHKIAIFYLFKAELDLLVLTFGHDKLCFTPEEFNASADKIFVSQIQSGREGVDCSTADAIVFYNMPFSYLSYAQGRQRHNFRDRTKQAPCYFIMADGGIEQHVYARVIKKEDYTLEYFKKDYGIDE